MRQAHLPKDAVATLASQHVGDPYGGFGFAKQRRYDRLASAGLDDVQHGERADKDPSGREAD